jgi:hypothetical protein
MYRSFRKEVPDARWGNWESNLYQLQPPGVVLTIESGWMRLESPRLRRSTNGKIAPNGGESVASPSLFNRTGQQLIYSHYIMRALVFLVVSPAARLS